ncbi:MAG: hypothetical protein ACM3U2_08865, partial [Deltaproteobacteria bacterium]
APRSRRAGTAAVLFVKLTHDPKSAGFCNAIRAGICANLPILMMPRCLSERHRDLSPNRTGFVDFLLEILPGDSSFFNQQQGRLAGRSIPQSES